MKQCKTCTHNVVCEKAKHVENYRFEGCEHYAPKSKWFSVKEQLPQPFEPVDLYLPKEEPWISVHEGYIDDIGRFHTLRLGTHEKGDVTHWKKRPEPPKEGKND